MRILVCGGRDYANPKSAEGMDQRSFMFDELDMIMKWASTNYTPNGDWLPTDITIISGGATGADTAASNYAVINYCQLEEYPADWMLYGKRAGFIRNKRMLVEGKPDLVVAFPGGKGTAMMMDIAKKAGVRVIDMGTLGSFSQTSKSPEIKTKKFMQEYIDRVNQFKMLTPRQKAGIYMEVLKAENDWLNNMGTEYDEIIAAQDALDATRGEIKDGSDAE